MLWFLVDVLVLTLEPKLTIRDSMHHEGTLPISKVHHRGTLIFISLPTILMVGWIRYLIFSKPQLHLSGIVLSWCFGYYDCPCSFFKFEQYESHGLFDFRNQMIPQSIKWWCWSAIYPFFILSGVSL